MGLGDAAEDLVPDTTTVDTGSKDEKDGSEETVVIGNPPHEKRFTQERWEQVKDALTGELGYTVREVKNMRSAERYEVLHEAAMLSAGEIEVKDTETAQPNKCAICSQRLPDEAVAEIAGEPFCPSHPSAKVAKYFNEE